MADSDVAKAIDAPVVGRGRVGRLGVSAAAMVSAVVLTVVAALTWHIAGRSDPAVERLVAQTQLIIATLGLIVTTVLAGTTLYYAVLTRRIAMATVASVDYQQRERKRAQADLIAAWCLRTSPAHDAPLDPATGVIDGPRVQANVVLRNASPSPIYRCTALVRPDWGDFPPTSHTVVGGGRYWPVFPPGDAIEWLDASPIAELLTTPPVDLIFTDAAGLHWLRRGSGRLEQLEENPGGVC